MSRRLSADPVGQVESARLSGVLFRAHPPGRVRGRLRLTMRRNDQGMITRTAAAVSTRITVVTRMRIQSWRASRCRSFNGILGLGGR